MERNYQGPFWLLEPLKGIGLRDNLEITRVDHHEAPRCKEVASEEEMFFLSRGRRCFYAPVHLE